MTGNFVAMETAICHLCGKEHETGNLLLDTRLQPRFEGRTAATSYELCPEHKAMVPEYVGIIVLKREPHPSEDPMRLRTGEYMHVRREVWARLFNVPAPESLCFLGQEGADKLKRVFAEAQEASGG